MRVCVGQIFGAHGVRGLVKLVSFTEDPESIAQYGPLTDESGERRFTVALAGFQKTHWIAQIDEIDDREAAQALNGTRLYAERDQLPPPEDEDEYYNADLIGLRADDLDGAKIGTVSALYNFGAGDIIELELESGARPLLPFDHATVPVVDVAGGRVVIDLPPGWIAEREA
jgi:16S rRNA processing protein RimM